jgi:hypothetical protein
MTGDEAHRSQPPAGEVLAGRTGPVCNDQRSVPELSSTAKMRPPSVAATTVPFATAGEERTAPPVRTCHFTPPCPAKNRAVETPVCSGLPRNITGGGSAPTLVQARRRTSGTYRAV